MTWPSQYGPHLERLQAVAASGGWLAIGGRRDAPDVSDSSVHLLQLPRLDVRFSAAVGAAVGALGFADDDWLLAGTSSGELLAWNLHAGDAPVLRRPLHGGALEALAPIPGARRVVSVGADGVLCIVQIDADGGGYQARIQAQRRLSAQALHAVVVDVAGNRIVAAGADSTIYVLALADASNAEPRVMPCGERGVFSLALSGDGRIVAGCGDGSIRVLFLEGAVDEEDRSGDDAHKGAVRGLAFSAALLDDQGRPLARRLFSVDSDGELKIWTLDNRRKPRTIAVGSGARALALSARSADAGPEKRGGVLAVVTENRRLWLSPVNQDGYPQDKGESWDSRLQRLLDDLAAQKPTAATLDTLGQLAEDEARQALERVLGADQRPPFRAQAAQLLAQRRRSRPALARALNDDHPSVRQAAFAALQVLAGDTPLAPLQAALASRHEDIRLVAVQRLPELRKASPLVPRLLGDSLKDKSEKVRETALDALIALEPDAPGASLRAAFERGSADVRQAVLIRLSRAGEAVVAERAQLLGQALNDETYEVRRAAFWIAVAMQPRLAARLDEASADFAKIFAELQKRGAAVAFAAERGKSALADTELEPLFTALAARQSDIALQGAVCLALLGDSRASGALLQLSRESNPAARRMVTRLITSAAIALADPQLRLRLLWLLNDTDPQVRAEAFDGLAKLAEPEGPRGEVELAAAALRTQSPDIRARALQALIKHGATAQGEMAGRIDGLLGDALDDEAEVVRREALRTLWAWYSKRPEATLRRAADSRHGDVRRWAVDELLRQPRAWAREMLIERIGDAVAEVGLAAYEALTKEDKDKKVPDTHLAALNAPTAEVRLAGLKGALEVRDAAPLRSRMAELLKDERADVFSAAIEAFDKLLPDDAYAFALAFDSPFYLLRVRAAELCGKRRDTRAVGPMQGLLGIPQSAADRPSDSLRRRAAGALADVGDAASIPFLASLLKDDDALVREQGARGLATACRSGQEQPLLDALDHPDLAVRSWAADGLARLGDTRALAVLAGTQRHDHAPIRRGALYSFVALGGAGMQGILQGLEDPERELQELAFAVVVARDIALARAQLPPDLLLSALTAAQPEIRYAAARTLEARLRAEDSAQWAPELVGPRQPEKAGDMRNWPEPAERPRLLNALINALAGHAPARRYAATQVFALRPQPEAFWREAKRLAGAEADQAPQTGAEGEASIERKTGWIRSLFSRAKSNEKSATQRVLTVLRFAGGGRAVPARQDRPADADLWRLVFGAYAGLVRQAPVDKGVDDAQRVRRDCIARLATLVEQAPVGRDAVLPVLRQALNDPHHLVRQAALETLRSLYPKDAVEPLALALGANAGDVGRNAFDRLLAVAATGKDIAAELARGALNAPHAEVRLYALEQLPRAYPEIGSLEPWLLALDSRYDDVRLAVVDLCSAPTTHAWRRRSTAHWKARMTISGCAPRLASPNVARRARFGGARCRLAQSSNGATGAGVLGCARPCAVRCDHRRWRGAGHRGASGRRSRPDRAAARLPGRAG
ncbi:MAG: HEAT repeat domain-containing protein [Gammaproteobacteria bacterium]